MPEEFYRHIHGFRLLEYVFGGNVAYKVLAEILVGGGVCGIISSDLDLEPVVEKGFRHLVAVAHLRAVRTVLCPVVLVYTEREIYAANILRRPVVDGGCHIPDSRVFSKERSPRREPDS